MTDRESAAVSNANKHFRKEAQAREGAAAWKEHTDREEATRLKTARLRAQRLARDAGVLSAATPASKRVARTKFANISSRKQTIRV
jgi:hypothetical protein